MTSKQLIVKKRKALLRELGEHAANIALLNKRIDDIYAKLAELDETEKEVQHITIKGFYHCPQPKKKPCKKKK